MKQYQYQLFDVLLALALFTALLVSTSGRVPGL